MKHRGANSQPNKAPEAAVSSGKWSPHPAVGSRARAAPGLFCVQCRNARVYFSNPLTSAFPASEGNAFSSEPSAAGSGCRRSVRGGAVSQVGPRVQRDWRHAVHQHGKARFITRVPKPLFGCQSFCVFPASSLLTHSQHECCASH